MNDRFYRFMLPLARFGLRAPPVASMFDLVSRVWGRHHALWRHLRAWQFDGVIDGGANVGEFAALARAALPAADLVCVEPHPPSATRLRRAGFRVVEAALWREAGRLTLAQPGAASTSCTVLSGTDAAAPRWEVAATRLDQLEITGDRLLIKLDLQGAESVALEGMGALWPRTAAVLMETQVGSEEDGAERQLREHMFFSYAVTNQLWHRGLVTEADTLWLRADVFAARATDERGLNQIRHRDAEITEVAEG